MPLKLNVGLSKKVGLPNYSSLGASCHLEVELDSQLLVHDPTAFHEQVQQTFEACSQAVHAELVRHVPSAHPTNGDSSFVSDDGEEQRGDPADDGINGHSANGEADQGRPWTSSRRATAAQVRAIFAISNRQKLDLPEELQRRFGIDRPDDLSVSEASQFIDELQTRANGTGGCR